MDGDIDGAPATDLPLLPRGTVVFTDLPARALVLEALAPAVGSGLLRVTSPYGAGFILVRDGALYETHAFSPTGAHTSQQGLEELRRWPEADVSADRLDVALVDLSAALLRSETLYDDLRLEWTSWPGLLADLGRREAAYIVELSASAGRGVTCVAGGRQLLSYTDVHPALGDPALLEAMASSGEGNVRVRRVAPHTFAHLLQSGAGIPVPAARPQTPGAAFPAPAPAAVWQPPATTASPPSSSHQPGPGPGSAPSLAAFAQTVAGADVAARQSPPAGPVSSVPPALSHSLTTPAGGEAGATEREEARPSPWDDAGEADAVEEAPDASEEAPDASSLGWVAPWQVAWGADVAVEAAPGGSPLRGLTVADVHAELREIAQRRLQLSASRVEVALDSAAAQDLPLDRVLDDLRSLSIRGVMQPTIDAMVDEMAEAAGRRVG
ncbi:MAG: hypothetical protein ACYDAC_08445 [Candidatus Dormibacteria bacterium]